MSIIVALSGGKASAWCANWALQEYKNEEVLLYFNDTKWEHPDLYRFLNDLSNYFKQPIIFDSDGRSPEDLFYDNNALANDRMAFCSRILKAERLHKFYSDGDTLVFGISIDEADRATKIIDVYKKVALKNKKWPKITFPLIREKVSRKEIDDFLIKANIEEPILYKLGFKHNNCSGGCVRASKKQWKLLYHRLPEVYLERERVEREMREYLGKDVSILRDETLESFRKRIENNELPRYYDMYLEDVAVECIGICSTFS